MRPGDGHPMQPALQLARETPWYAANVVVTRARRTLHDHPIKQAAAGCPLLR
jgi:hypothetical protein